MFAICVPMEIPADSPAVYVLVRQDVTTHGESYSPASVSRLALRSLPSGQFLTKETAAEAAVSGALALIRDVASALPHNPEQDAIVEKLFAEVVGTRETRPLRKPAR